MMDLADAARHGLARYTTAEEPLRPLYLQLDRAVFLAAGAQIVLKVYADGALLRREWAMARQARALGIPTPDLLGFEDGPPAIFAMRQVVGEPLSSRRPLAAREAGALLARFHGLGAAAPFAGGYARWDSHILAWADRELASVRRLAALTERAVATLRDRFVRLEPRLAGRPITLLHGDLQPDHVLVAAGGEGVAAFLDFADAQPGDPLFDIAVLSLWDHRIADFVLAGYDTIDNDAATGALLADYRLLRLVSEIPWLLERGFDALAARNIAALDGMLTGAHSG